MHEYIQVFDIVVLGIFGYIALNSISRSSSTFYNLDSCTVITLNFDHSYY